MKRGRVIRVNHGRCFGHSAWWMFYCPNCKETQNGIKVGDTHTDCPKCGCHIDWTLKESSE